MRYESIETTQLNGHNFSSTPGDNTDIWSKQGGIWVPRSIADIRTDLGVGLASRDIFYGSSAPGTPVNQSIIIPAWAKTYRFRIQAAGSGSNSGVVQPTTTSAVSGGGTGAAGYYLDVQGQASELTSLGSNTIDLTLGAPGAGGNGVTNLTGNLGGSGNDTTVVINSVTVFRVRGGTASTATTSAGSNPVATQGGQAGVNGAAGGSTTGVSGVFNNTLNVAASGGSGAGIASSGSSQVGGGGARGGTLGRNPTEAIPAGGSAGGGSGANAIEVLVGGVPVPGNGGGGGGSNTAGGGGNGGNGINGSSGGGGGSCRSGTSGKGGNGGRAFAVIEFFGTAANTLEVISETPVPFGGRLSCVDNDPIGNGGVGSILYYEPFISLSYPSINGDTDQIIAREIPSIGLSMDFTGLAANCYDLFLRYNRTTQQTELARVAWTNTTTRGYTPVRVRGLTVYANNNATNKEYLLIGTVYWNGTQLRNSSQFRWISNLYNGLAQDVFVSDGSSAWSVNNTAPRVIRNQPSLNVIEVVNCLTPTLFDATALMRMIAGSGNVSVLSFGVNSQSVTSGQLCVTAVASDNSWSVRYSQSLTARLNQIYGIEYTVFASPSSLHLGFAMNGSWMC